MDAIRRTYQQAPGHAIMTFYVPDELVLSPNNKPETLIEFIQLFAEIKQDLERYIPTHRLNLISGKRLCRRNLSQRNRNFPPPHPMGSFIFP